MKIDKAVSCLWGCMLAFLLSFASICCLSTAFEMAVDMKVMVLWCAGAAVVSSVCFILPLGLVPLGGVAVIGGYMWQAEELLPAIESLLNRLTLQYNKAYGWNVVQWSGLTPEEMELLLTPALCMLGVVIAIVAAWTICRRRSVVLAMTLSLLPLMACMVVTDTVPQVAWLFFLLLSQGMLLITGNVRQQDEEQGNRLNTVVVLPVAMSLLILFAAVPQNQYRGKENAQKILDMLLQIEPLRFLVGEVTEQGTAGTSVDGRTVNLRTVGVRQSSQAEVFRVNAGYSDTLYLRGRGLDAYDGVSWQQSDKSTTVLNWPTEGMDTAGEVVITTRYAHRMLYLPYYVKSKDLQYVNLGLENEKKLTQYSFSCWEMPDAADFNKLYPSPYAYPDSEWSADMLRQFISLPDEVRRWAEPLVKEIVGNSVNSPYHKAQLIAEYVRNSATYDLKTRRMPSDETDFARWFLEDSDTGYCVHFATAATVLLQAAGIPARYVTGYMIAADEYEMEVVRADDAHAWAEYWLPGFGWAVLEATPAAVEEETTQPQQTTEITDPSEETAGEQQETTRADQQKPDQPSADDPTATPQAENKSLLTMLLCVTGVALLVAGTEGQRVLRLWLRRRRRNKKTVNEQVLLLWQEAERLAAILKQEPEETLYHLALKAKFSQHTLDDRQLALFDAYILDAQNRLKKRSVFHRFWYRIVLVLY